MHTTIWETFYTRASTQSQPIQPPTHIICQEGSITHAHHLPGGLHHRSRRRPLGLRCRRDSSRYRRHHPRLSSAFARHWGMHVLERVRIMSTFGFFGVLYYIVCSRHVCFGTWRLTPGRSLYTRPCLHQSLRHPSPQNLQTLSQSQTLSLTTLRSMRFARPRTSYRLSCGNNGHAR